MRISPELQQEIARLQIVPEPRARTWSDEDLRRITRVQALVYARWLARGPKKRRQLKDHCSQVHRPYLAAALDQLEADGLVVREGPLYTRVEAS